MQITLCEDDGIFHDGVPTMVVLMVTFDDGKKKRIPYPAEKSISALYQDLNEIAPKVSVAPQENIADGDFVDIYNKNINVIAGKFEPVATTIKAMAPKSLIDKSNIIEKEDIVTLVMLDPGREKDETCLLEVGQELRVIKVKYGGTVIDGVAPQAQQYDVVNDQSGRPERTVVYPHEVRLKRKRMPPVAVLEHKFEEMLPCPSCSAVNALMLEGDEFKGVCSECQCDIIISRIIAKCKTPKCNGKVSCFDVGGSYEGQCNQCKAKIEVPYA